MNLCSDGHAEICFEGKVCPLCRFLDEIKSLEETVKDLERRLDIVEKIL